MSEEVTFDIIRSCEDMEGWMNGDDLLCIKGPDEIVKSKLDLHGMLKTMRAEPGDKLTIVSSPETHEFIFRLVRS